MPAHGRDGKEIECGGTKRYISQCLQCHAKVVIHCGDCGKQMSGCACTIREQIEKERRN